jgi:outer membrane protein TolC
MKRSAAGSLLAGALLAGCAAQPYHPAPIIAEQSASQFESRTLADPGLRRLAQAYLGDAIMPWPPAAWDLQTLTLAALYFNPELDEARARSAESQAEIISAEARPNPSLGVTPGVPSPYLLSLELAFPIETAGKRRYRAQAAEASARASTLDLAQSAWNLRDAVRAALVDYQVAGRTLELLRAEVEVRDHQVRLLERMSSLGEIPSLEAHDARIEWSKARALQSAAEEKSAEATAALAAAIGIPAAALRNVSISWPAMDTPPDVESLPAAQVRRDAVLNRLNVRSALARYAAAEARLRLEIARQYPDLDIGPGYTYEEKHSYFTLGFSVVIPIFDRNRGPIAAAEARREQAAAVFVATQSQVIQTSERSLAMYAVALRELADAKQLAQLTERRRSAAGQSVRAGEQGGLELADAEIERSMAMRGELEALARAQRALGELEDAVQRPLGAGDELAAEAVEAESLGERPQR